MLTKLFAKPKPIIGMIHVGALPGTPASSQSVAEIVAQAVFEAALYREAGVDGIAIENMHDVPYLRGEVGPEIVAAMALVGQAVKAESQLPVGIQILAGANLEAMAVAHAANLDFIRAESFAFAH
ncbi:MAG: BtpA family membrane complex biogenesis protein, partial [Acidobacteria bacterium]|nr:BtpA family membrane complex biogenesis protein [Acidobacteriota bacterium]